MEVKLDFDDVLIVPKFSDITSRQQVDLNTTLQGKWGASITGVPIIAANMDGVGTFSMNRALSKYNVFTALTKHTTFPQWQSEILHLMNENPTDNVPEYLNIIDKMFISIGMNSNELLHVKSVVKIIRESAGSYTPKIVIDVANGYMNPFYDFIKQTRDAFPDSFIMAGTVVTPEATERVINSGADLARVGIGTGAVCTTRRVAGVGYPQFSALKECVEAADAINGGVQSDGGCVYPGDFSKAFGIGAQMIMAGSIFAGHDESEQEVFHGKVTFYGMSSHIAQKKHNNVKNYRASEGRIVQIPYKGAVENTISEILGGIRSTCAYVNAKTLTDLPKNCNFIRVNNQLNRSLEKYGI